MITLYCHWQVIGDTIRYWAEGDGLQFEGDINQVVDQLYKSNYDIKEIMVIDKEIGVTEGIDHRITAIEQP